MDDEASPLLDLRFEAKAPGVGVLPFELRSNLAFDLICESWLLALTDNESSPLLDLRFEAKAPGVGVLPL